MATWAQFTTAEPELAATGGALLFPFKIAYLATVRADGAPRVHPVSPFIIEGRLIVATPPSSPKARDHPPDVYLSIMSDTGGDGFDGAPLTAAN